MAQCHATISSRAQQLGIQRQRETATETGPQVLRIAEIQQRVSAMDLALQTPVDYALVVPH
jgi:hypothetical protein